MQVVLILLFAVGIGLLGSEDAVLFYIYAFDLDNPLSARYERVP